MLSVNQQATLRSYAARASRTAASPADQAAIIVKVIPITAPTREYGTGLRVIVKLVYPDGTTDLPADISRCQEDHTATEKAAEIKAYLLEQGVPASRIYMPDDPLPTAHNGNDPIWMDSNGYRCLIRKKPYKSPQQWMWGVVNTTWSGSATNEAEARLAAINATDQIQRQKGCAK
jgi:hypothetical protein